MLLLILAKVATVYVPIIYAQIVDDLAPRDGGAMLAVPIGLVVAYGAAAHGLRRVRRVARRAVRHAYSARCAVRRGERSSTCTR